MPIDVAGPLLLTTRPEGYRPLGFGGEPIHATYRKLVSVIESRLGPEAARYLARPEIDEATHSIGWHAACEGPVRRWSQLTLEEQAAMATAFTNLQARLRDLAIDLEKAGTAGGAKENFGHALRLALRSPGLDNLFFVGDQPVLTAWGSESGSGGFDSLAFDPKAPSRAVTTGTVVEAAVLRSGASWWRWLLWLLGLLLLLLLLLFFLRSCLNVPVPLVDKILPDKLLPAPAVPPGAPPAGTTTLEPNGTTTVVPGGTIVGPGDGSVVPGTEGGTLGNGGTVPGAPDNGTTPPAGTMPPEGATPSEGSTLPEGSVNPPPAGTEPNKPAGTEPSNPAATPPAPENPAGTPPNPDSSQGQNPGSPPQPPGAEPPVLKPPSDQSSANGNNPPAEALKIPPPGSNGQGLGFLQGEWKSKSGLYDRATGKPLTQTYSFDNQGKGTVTIYRADSSQCKGKARAQMTAKGGVRIEDTGPVVCPDGTTYAPSVTQCERGKTGEATCTGVNKAGSTYHVEIAR
jgi:hypothetical protein